MKLESRKYVLSLDPNVRPMVIKDWSKFRQRFQNWLNYVDILRLSEVDFLWLYPGKEINTLLLEWFNAGLSLVILTRGQDGAQAFLPNSTQVFAPAQ